MVVHIYNPSTQETEAGGWKIQGQPGLHNKTLPQKIKEGEREKEHNNKYMYED
jgi:hypothetical protein